MDFEWQKGHIRTVNMSFIFLQFFISWGIGLYLKTWSLHFSFILFGTFGTCATHTIYIYAIDMTFIFNFFRKNKFKKNCAVIFSFHL